MPRVVIALAVIACVVGLALAGPNSVQTDGLCQAGQCQAGNPYGIMKPSGSSLISDEAMMECCDGDYCFDARMDKCMEPSEKYYNGGKKMVCNKHWGKPCGNACINTYNQICTSAKPVTGTYYIEGPASRTLVMGTAVKVVAVPLFGILFGLIGFAASLLSLRHTFSSLSVSQKICVALTLPMLVFNFFMFFGSGEGWKFASLLTSGLCLTVVSFGIENKFLTRFTTFYHLALLLYLVGPNFAGNAFFSAGNGLIDAVSSCNGDNGWTSHWSIQNVGQDSDETDWNPNEQNWGFCAPAFLTWQAIVALFLITFEFFEFVLFLASTATPLGGMGGEPLLK